MSDIGSVIRGFLRQALMPLVAMSIRHNVKLADFIDVLKECFVEAAQKELEANRRPVSASKVSVMSGVHRRDTSSILKRGSPNTASINLIAKVLGLWQYKRSYQNADGTPKILSIEGRGSQFAKLVNEVSADLNPYTVLFELERLQAVRRTTRGVELNAKLYEPAGDVAEGLSLLAGDVADLCESVGENIFARERSPNLHIKTSYDNIPRSAQPEIREWLLNEGRLFHERARDYLSRFDRDLSGVTDTSDRSRVAVGTFSRIENISGDSR